MAEISSLKFDAIGTAWIIDFYDAMSVKELQKLEQLIKLRIDNFDVAYSRFRPDSLLSSLAVKAGTVTLPDDSKHLFDVYQKLYEVTNGKVTPLIGDVLVHAGYDADYSLQPKPGIKKALRWEEVMNFDYPKLTVVQPTTVDVGAAGKGYLVDIVCELLLAQGQQNFVVDAGGDMRHVGNQPSAGLRVGLEHPRDAGQVIGVATLTGQSICCSADNRRRWAGMHHVMDPDTGYSTEDVIACWVIADDCITADGLATALFFCPPIVLKSKFNFEYVLIRNDMQAEASSSSNIELFGDTR